MSDQLMLTIHELTEKSALLRAKIIEYSGRTKTPHLASCLSCADLLAVYYFDILKFNTAKPLDEQRDRFILSKGHAAPAIFQVLSMAGFFPEALLLNDRPSRFRSTIHAKGWPHVSRAGIEHNSELFRA